MEATAIFKKLTDACDDVLKESGAAVLTSRKMTQDEFADYATGEIQKAKAEADDASTAIARLSALRTSIMVAKSAFIDAKVESFEVPVFDESAHDRAMTAKKMEALEAEVADLKSKLGKTDGKTDEKAEKADADADAADEKADDEKAEKTDDEKAEKADDEKADDADEKTEDDDAEDVSKSVDQWPMDLSKRYKDDEIRELYDWGPDPR